MGKETLSGLLDTIAGRRSRDGGLSALPGSPFDTEATAWGAVALEIAGAHGDILASCLDKLSAVQSSDGRISLYGDHPEVCWPTPLALLAWHGSDRHRKSLRRGTAFLLNTTGRHWRKPVGYPCDYDTSIRGWPWVNDAHSWVEPTALALLALDVTGHGSHGRFLEGTRMLLDRQLPHGGWNFGMTIMYGHEIPPQGHTTGVALAALEDCAPPETVRKGIDFLKSDIHHVRTPLSLCWSILGLSAWQARPAGADAMIAESLLFQQRYGAFDTSLISIMAIALCAEQGLKRAMK